MITAAQAREASERGLEANKEAQKKEVINYISTAASAGRRSVTLYMSETHPELIDDLKKNGYIVTRETLIYTVSW